MSTAAPTRPLEMNALATRALKAAAGFWFLVAVIGQWAFLYYVLMAVGAFGFSMFMWRILAKV